MIKHLLTVLLVVTCTRNNNSCGICGVFNYALCTLVLFCGVIQNGATHHFKTGPECFDVCVSCRK